MSKSEPIVDDQYQEILLSQLKEKNDEIKQDVQSSHKQFGLLKSQMSALCIQH